MNLPTNIAETPWILGKYFLQSSLTDPALRHEQIPDHVNSLICINPGHQTACHAVRRGSSHLLGAMVTNNQNTESLRRKISDLFFSIAGKCVQIGDLRLFSSACFIG